MIWLLEKSVKDRFEKFLASDLCANSVQSKDVQITSSVNSTVNVVGNTAYIDIIGILTKEPDFFAALFFGNTAYNDIISALQEADGNNNIANIQLNIDSPGGSVDGIFETIDALQSTTKPISALINNNAFSGAYIIASQADTIIANNRGSSVGSVGVVRTMYINDDVIDITSSNAPNKRPDITTKEGKAVVIQELDDIEDLIIDAVVNGRNTSKENVTKNFGRGGVFLADEAKNRGMIDSIKMLPANSNNGTLAKGKNTKNLITKNGGNQSMDLNQLKAEHNELFQTVLSDGSEAGIAKERDRVTAHLTMGEASGDMKTAIESIKDGSEMTATLQAKYMAANLNRNNQDARVEDNPDEVTPKATATETVDIVASAIEKQMGFKKKGDTHD